MSLQRLGQVLDDRAEERPDLALERARVDAVRGIAGHLDAGDDRGVGHAERLCMRRHLHGHVHEVEPFRGKRLDVGDDELRLVREQREVGPPAGIDPGTRPCTRVIAA